MVQGKGTGYWTAARPACLPARLLSLTFPWCGACTSAHLFMASLKLLVLSALWASISARLAWNRARRRR